MKVTAFIFFSFKHGMIEMVIIMKKILIVEDDESIADSLKEMLEHKDYIVEVSYSKKETLEKLNEYIDLILLDIQLPDGNGISLCKEIKEKYEVPIIFLSCLSDEETIVTGLNEGGDDYVCKPFGIKELCARIECNLRKVTKQQGVYYIDDLIIDTLKHKVFKDNKELELSTITFALLVALVEGHGRVLTRDYLLMLIEDITGHVVEDNTLTAHLKRLRQTLGEYQNRKYIETLRVENIKKEKNNHVCLIISFVLMIVVEIYSFLVSNIFNVFIFTSILFYFLEQKNKKKQMNYLIQCCDAIIEQKDFSIIDGESKESLLSNKLFLLNKRYHQSLKAIKKEQLKLKDYIEDISHQLKTPITSIRIQTELLLEENQNKKLYAIEHQIQRIQLLVNDLQTIALLDSHNIQYCFKEYDLQMLIDEIEEDLDYLNPQIHLNKNIKVLCDEKWFIEALENIIKNCLEKNSTLLSIFAYENETTLKMMIQDQGNGFKEKDLPFLFQRFYRGENSKGTGLGLYIAKEIIEAHHGFIKAYNQQGACFEIVLPQMKMKKKI